MFLKTLLPSGHSMRTQRLSVGDTSLTATCKLAVLPSLTKKESK